MKKGPGQERVVLERLFELAGLLGEAMNSELAGDGLTPARAEVVWRLQHHGPMTQRELSEALRCTPRNVTGLVDGLEAAGLAARSRHPSDRRASLVALTEAGAARAASWRAGYQALAAELLGDLGADDLSHLTATLDKILTRLRTSHPATGSPA
jgi:DNA-binding MarR family transcriptional regulator